MAVAAYFYYEKLRRTMRTAIVSYLRNITEKGNVPASLLKVLLVKMYINVLCVIFII